MGSSCPESYNPADFFIGILAIQPETEQECKKFVTECCDAFDSSTVGQEVVATAKLNITSSKANGRDSNAVEVRKESTYKASWLNQLGAVFKRAALENIREPGVLKSQLFQIIVTGLLVGLIYMGQELTNDGVNNINGAIFIMLSQNSFGFTFSVLQTFCVTLPIFLREHFSGMYRTDVYYIAKSVAEVPLSFILPLFFSGIAYYMIGLNPAAERFFTCLGLLVLIANVSTSFGE
ncbi:ATPase activity protein [Halocaridina rubra]|uniref:ATPase activity protein n=1 Tax=Halocaridina rubra TaxID=373956 RepID=A0AAN8ZRZ7_HALRR